MLPKKSPTALSSTCEITKDGLRKLFEWGTGLYNTLEARNDACLCSFFLPRLVKPAEIVTSLEDMV